MKQRLSILKSKLSLPKTSDTLERDRLSDILKDIFCKKLALVIAGAGYGKTTLVAQAVTAMGTDTVWYSLDESDRDFATFMGYLIAGIREYHPEFGKELTEKIAVPRISSKNREPLLTEFLAEAESRVSDHMILVLDDFYLVEKTPEISASVEFLLARIPPFLHLIIISRTEPAIKISRYRAMLEVIDVGEAELSFRTDEIGSLFRKLLNTGISAATIRKLSEKTGGWAAGLLLFFNALKIEPSGNIAETLFDIGRSEKLIFQYLDENIFEKQSGQVRDFMVRSSLLSRLDPDLCDAVFRREDSCKILKNLCENHLLTFPCGGTENCFRYHHLLRDFLRDKLAQNLGREESRRLCHDIGRVMEERGNLHGALRYFLKGSHFGEVGRIIGGMMLQDFIDCPLRFLSDAFDRIPAEQIHKDARLLYIGARLASLKGEVRKAISGFQIALKRFRQDGNSMGIANCLKDLGYHYYLTGDILRAQKQMEELWGKPHDDPFFPVEVAGYLIFFSAILGKTEAADHYYQSFRSLFTGKGKTEKELIRSWLDFCHSNRFHASGDFDTAHKINTKVLNTFTRMKMELFIPLVSFQTALISFYRAESEKGHEYAENGIFMAEKLGIYDHQYAWLLYVRGLNSFGKDEPDQALSDAEKSSDIFREYDHFWGQASVYELYCMIYRKAGKLAEAESVMQKGLNLIRGMKLSFSEGAFALGLGEVLADQGEYSRAGFILKQYRKKIEISGFHLLRYHLIRTRIHYQAGDVEKAVKHMETALTISLTNQYDAWVLRELPQVLPVLISCHDLGIMKAYIEDLLKRTDRETGNRLCSLRNEMKGRMRRAADTLIPLLPRSASAPLTIRCLGRFRVSVGDREIPPDQWRSTKAAMLFRYMVMKREQGFVPKDLLLEFAWPDEDRAKTNRRFHVAMNALRKLLEPDLKRGVPSAYILRQNDAYRLEIGSKGRIDFREFTKAVEQAERAEKRDADDALKGYLKAERIYGGPLFEETPYEDRFAEEREFLTNRYLHTLSKIIRLYEDKEAWKEAVEYAEKYLTVDKYAEPVYCDLMRFYSYAGEISRILRTFQRCQTAISEELECPLNEKTTALYRLLTGKTEGAASLICLVKK